MVVLRLGNIDNIERKFIPTKKEIFEDYLNNLQQIEEYELTQTFKDGYKYRKYNDNGIFKYTRNKKCGTITEVIEITEEEFADVLESNGKVIRKIRKYYLDGIYEIDVDYFLEPIEMIMIEVATSKGVLDDYIPPKGFVEVTKLAEYQNTNIYNGSIKANNTIIEGADGVGKSVTIEKLLEKGIIAQDRCMDMISKNMLFNISTEDRAMKYQEYLKNMDKMVIILVNNDSEELRKRINKKDELSEFDKYATEYNELYLETYEFMKNNNMLENKMILVDVTGKTLDEQVELVEKKIMGE